MVIESSVDGGSGFDVPDTPEPPPAPPPSPEPEPRITNDAEGSKKQKEAVKKLSTYSREVAERKAERLKSSTTETESTSDDVAVEPTVNPSEAQASSVMLTGNIIAAIGVGVAALCLYLSYSPKPTPSDPPRPPPPTPKSPKATQPSRFKRL